MPKITVLMPSLNVAKYINACMESVLAQTMPDIEVLAIDAGSDDGTLEILQGYAELDTRVKVIRSAQKSYGYQINQGIELAQGDYISIVETDDIIVPDMYEALLLAADSDVDYLKGRFVKFVDIGNEIYCTNPIGVSLECNDIFGKIIEPRNMPELLVKDIYLWTGIYKREFLYDNRVRLNESAGAAFQDQGFLFQTISSARKAVYIEKVVYRYRQDNGNSSVFNKKGFGYIAGEYAYIERFLRGKDEKWKKVYYTRMLNQCIGRFEMMAVSGTFWDEAISDIEMLREKLFKAVEDNVLQPEDMEQYRWKLLELYLKGAKCIYKQCLEDFQKKAAPFYRILEKIEGNPVIIFGCGKYGKFIHALIENRKQGQAIAFCDNNPDLWNVKVQGLKVLSPDDAVRQQKESVFVIANLKSADTIRHQLQTLGIDDERMCFYQDEVNMLLFQIRGEKDR